VAGSQNWVATKSTAGGLVILVADHFKGGDVLGGDVGQDWFGQSSWPWTSGSFCPGKALGIRVRRFPRFYAYISGSPKRRAKSMLKTRDFEMQTVRRAFIAGAARVCAFLVLCAATGFTQTATLTTLHSFAGAPTDGANPYAGVVQTTKGDFYGTTEGGGTNCDTAGCGGGTVFKITAGGKETPIYTFCSPSGCADGEAPNAGLIQATNGDLYGTTVGGGTIGAGTVFRITLDGKLTTLHSFAGSPTEGAAPLAGLIQGTNGDFYGTTRYGGAYGYGTVFKITPGGTPTTLYSFCKKTNCTDGSDPTGGLIQAIDGDFYGTTEQGGAYTYGTVFKITPGGKLTTLHNFCSQTNCTDGALPIAGLVQGTDGFLYGTTEGGGYGFQSDQGAGTAFKMTLGGDLAWVYPFCSQVLPNGVCLDGFKPYMGLVQGTDGNFYGITPGGGAYKGGGAFQITPSGTLTPLYGFCSPDGYPNCPDGVNPEFGALIQGTNGDFYGTTASGGADGDGTVFSLSVGLGPFVEPQTTSGKVGAAVTILGNKLTGASSVTFDGTEAVFTVNSTGTAISTTVPASATSGTIQVLTASNGTLSSNVPFTVVP
jgi:uncharacterized repeat protein (TIGR03803 family)